MLSYYVWTNNGKSSANRVLDSLDELKRFAKDNGITEGSVFVYEPHWTGVSDLGQPIPFSPDMADTGHGGT